MSILLTYRRLLWPLYVPSSLFSIAVQAVLLLIPLYLLELGHGAALASFVVGLRGVGMLLADIPTGSLATRYGDRPIMVWGSIGVGAGCLLIACFESIFALSMGALVAGFSSAAWLVGRLSFISDTCEPGQKGRVIAMMAGTQRLGGVIGPALGGVLATLLGYEITIAIAGVIAIFSGIITQLASPNTGTGGRHAGNPLERLGIVLGNHRQLFLTAGFGAMTLMMLRAARQLIIPLYGASIGLDAAEVGAIYAISAMVDMAMFYPAGQAMDRFGRKATAVPGALLLATGTLGLLLVDGYVGLLLVACLSGLGNGVTTGVLMAMGSDFSPAENRGEFLGVWRFTCDLGFAGGPLLVSGIAAVSGIGSAAAAIALLGYAGAWVLARRVPESIHAGEKTAD